MSKKIVFTGSYRKEEDNPDIIKIGLDKFAKIAFEFGKNIALQGYNLIMVWSDQNIESQTLTRDITQGSRHPYWEGADYHAMAGYLQALEETPALLDNDFKITIIYMPSSEPNVKFTPFANTTRNSFVKVYNLDIEAHIDDGWITIDRRPVIKDFKRQALLDQQAEIVDVFITLGGGKATKTSAKTAFERDILIPLNYAGGFVAKKYLTKLPDVQNQLDKYNRDSKTLVEKAQKFSTYLHDILHTLEKPKIVVITIRSDEFKGVCKHLNKLDDIRCKNGRYSVGDLIHSDGQKLKIAVVRLPNEGESEAQDKTRDVIEDLDPTLIILCGIGGGIPTPDYTLGDVMISNRMYDFSTGALEKDGSRTYINQGGPLSPMVKNLIGNLPNIEENFVDWKKPDLIGSSKPLLEIIKNGIYGQRKWRKNVEETLAVHFDHHANTKQKLSPKRKYPIYNIRAIGGDGNLIKNPETVAQWLDNARDLVSIEMEFAGAYKSCQRMDHNQNKIYNLISIRGISDIIGLKRVSGFPIPPFP